MTVAVIARFKKKKKVWKTRERERERERELEAHHIIHFGELRQGGRERGRT